MFLTFNVCDFIGRNLPTFYIISPLGLWILVFSRFIFWVTFLLVTTNVSPDWLFGATWFKFVNMAFFAVTNGYSCTCAMISGPAQVKPAWKDKAGSIMLASLVWGITVGAVLALSFTPEIGRASCRERV